MEHLPGARGFVPNATVGACLPNDCQMETLGRRGKRRVDGPHPRSPFVHTRPSCMNIHEDIPLHALAAR